MSDFEKDIDLSFLDEEDSVISPEDLAWDHAMDISGSIYQRLRELRMSQSELAARLGVSAGRVSQIIKGDPGMSLRLLARLETALDFRLDTGFRRVSLSYSSSSVTLDGPKMQNQWQDRNAAPHTAPRAPWQPRIVIGGLHAA